MRTRLYWNEDNQRDREPWVAHPTAPQGPQLFTVDPARLSTFAPEPPALWLSYEQWQEMGGPVEIEIEVRAWCAKSALIRERDSGRLDFAATAHGEEAWADLMRRHGEARDEVERLRGEMVVAADLTDAVRQGLPVPESGTSPRVALAGIAGRLRATQDVQHG